ncbi:MAG: outer membrane beta-barrel protein [Proteobacteria bacterium]|nr:outer membrane beta-barrel protein [Pseudomonadota bacterium]MDA1326514.1 outer membrane beta-barrel protein [Pseudomonadota bacterium]
MAQKRTSAVLIAAVISSAMIVPTAVAAKDAGDILVRLRGIGFMTDTSGTTDTLGGSARTSDAYVPELDFTYFITKNIAAELILATTKHSVEVKSSSSGDLDLGTVSLIPPVLTLQYHFLPAGTISPYIGAGISYVIVAGHNTGRSATSVSYSNEFGYAFQAGVDYRLNDVWSLNFDVKKIFVDTDIRVNGGAINANNTDLDPWVVGFGLGYKF